MIIDILENRLLYCNPGASIDASKLNRYYGFIAAHPEVVRDSLNRFIDFSGLVRFDMNPGHFRTITEMRSVLAQSLRLSRAVLYSDQPVGFEAARFCAGFLVTQNIHTQAIADLENALAWLGAADLKVRILKLQRRA